MLFIELRLFMVNFACGEQQSVVKAVEQVIRRQTVPCAHDSHIYDKCGTRALQASVKQLLFCECHHYAREQVVAEPVRKRYVPSVPEVRYIDCGERSFEIVRCPDAEYI